jgi:hypothetical protein
VITIRKCATPLFPSTPSRTPISIPCFCRASVLQHYDFLPAFLPWISSPRTPPVGTILFLASAVPPFCNTMISLPPFCLGSRPLGPLPWVRSYLRAACTDFTAIVIISLSAAPTINYTIHSLIACHLQTTPCHDPLDRKNQANSFLVRKSYTTVIRFSLLTHPPADLSCLVLRRSPFPPTSSLLWTDRVLGWKLSTCLSPKNVL